jgi:hypothetical protein
MEKGGARYDLVSMSERMLFQRSSLVRDMGIMVFTPGMVPKKNAWKIVKYLRALCVES